MATIVQGKNSTILDQQKSSCCNSLTYFVIVKSIIKLNSSSSDFIDLKNHLNILLDEPVTFVVKNNDFVSRETITKVGYPYKVMTLKEMKSLNKNSVLVLFIFDKLTSKTKKIIEIICNKKFHKSILLV